MAPLRPPSGYHLEGGQFFAPSPPPPARVSGQQLGLQAGQSVLVAASPSRIPADYDDRLLVPHYDVFEERGGSKGVQFGKTTSRVFDGGEAVNPGLAGKQVAALEAARDAETLKVKELERKLAIVTRSKESTTTVLERELKKERETREREEKRVKELEEKVRNLGNKVIFLEHQADRDRKKLALEGALGPSSAASGNPDAPLALGLHIESLLEAFGEVDAIRGGAGGAGGGGGAGAGGAHHPPALHAGSFREAYLPEASLMMRAADAARRKALDDEAARVVGSPAPSLGAAERQPRDPTVVPFPDAPEAHALHHAHMVPPLALNGQPQHHPEGAGASSRRGGGAQSHRPSSAVPPVVEVARPATFRGQRSRLEPKWKHERGSLTLYTPVTSRERVGGGFSGVQYYQPAAADAYGPSGGPGGAAGETDLQRQVRRLAALVEYYEELVLQEQGAAIVPERQLRRYAQVTEEARAWVYRLHQIVMRVARHDTGSSRQQRGGSGTAIATSPPPANGGAAAMVGGGGILLGAIGEVPSGEELESWRTVYTPACRLLEAIEERSQAHADLSQLNRKMDDELRVLRGVVYKQRFNFGVQTDDESAYYAFIDQLVDECIFEVAMEPHELDRGHSTGIPPLIVELLSDRYRDAVDGEIVPVRSVYKMINQVYQDKIKADAADDRDNNPRQGMPEYLYDWFTTKHGIRVVAEGNLVSLVFSLNRYENEHPAIETFNRFLDRHPRKVCDFFLATMRLAQASRTGMLFPDIEGHGMIITAARAIAVARQVFAGLHKETLFRLEGMIEARCTVPNDALMKKNHGLQKTKILPLLSFLDLVVAEWYAEHQRARDRLARLFDEFDKDRSGTLGIDEFTEMVKTLGIDIRRPLQLFREKTRAGATQTMSRATWITFGPEAGIAFSFPANLR